MYTKPVYLIRKNTRSVRQPPLYTMQNSSAYKSHTLYQHEHTVNKAGQDARPIMSLYETDQNNTYAVSTNQITILCNNYNNYMHNNGSDITLPR